MPLNEFWYGDIRLLGVYQKAYIRDKSYTAWVHGKYNSAGFGITLSNAFAKKGTPVVEYPDWKDPLPPMPQEIITEENIEQKFRELQASQNLWLHNMINQ
jgi:hypothetical protein